LEESNAGNIFIRPSNNGLWLAQYSCNIAQIYGVNKELAQIILIFQPSFNFF
jgi:hypothetical protein